MKVLANRYYKARIGGRLLAVYVNANRTVTKIGGASENDSFPEIKVRKGRVVG